MEEKKNLCAPIPLSLHQRLRAEQEQRGQTLSDYITDILREHFEGGARTMNANNRTIAFQVPEELFGRLKDYLARNGLKQKDFILGLIERELNDASVASGHATAKTPPGRSTQTAPGGSLLPSLHQRGGSGKQL